MADISSFLSSPFVIFIIVLIVFWVVLRMISKEVFGRPIGEVILSRRKVHFRDLDVDPHLILYRQLIRAAKFSRGSFVRALYLRPLDRSFYSTETYGLKRIGYIVGMATFPSVHIIAFKRAWWRIRKFIFISPPDLLRGGTSSRNIIYEGISVNLINFDWFYPMPSPKGKYTEQWMHIWALRTYDTHIKILEKAMLSDRALYLMWKASDDPTEVRMAMQGIAGVAQATEQGEDTAPAQSAVPGATQE